MLQVKNLIYFMHLNYNDSIVCKARIQKLAFFIKEIYSFSEALTISFYKIREIKTLIFKVSE